MHAILWLLQVALAFLYASGGLFKITSFEQVAPAYPAIPPAGWTALGLLEVAGAILLVVPAATRWKPVLTPIAAAALAVESLALGALFASYSLDVAVTNPMVWNVAMGLLAAVVAWGRFSIRPIAARRAKAAG